jgi:DNA polymerase-3 subunit beta
MKIKVDKASFIKSWSLAEHSSGASSSVNNIYSTVRMKAGDENSDIVELQSTDIKTSIKCTAAGVLVLEPGEAVIPIKGVSDLFRKAGSSEFTIQVDEGKALMISGRSRYRFSTYPAAEFPKLPSSDGGSLFCRLKPADLSSALDRGTLCATPNEDYPQYLSSACLEMEEGVLKVVSTDKRRLALCKAEVTEAGEGKPMLLPIKSVKELQKVLGMMDRDEEISVLYDDAQAYFIASGMEFAIRKVESSFPDYARILPKTSSTTMYVDRTELASAVERVDVVVRDYNRTVIMSLSNDGDCVLSGRAQEFGEAVESITCDVEGDSLRSGFNTRFFMDAIKALDGQVASLSFNGPDSHMVVRSRDSDSFFCMVAPVELSKEEFDGEEDAHEGDVL